MSVLINPFTKMLVVAVELVTSLLLDEI